jgi:hypothetical protein
LRENTLLKDKFKNSEEYKMPQNDSMVCPHLREWHMACCLIGKSSVVLEFMVKEYCRSSNHKNCPFLKHSLR